MLEKTLHTGNVAAAFAVIATTADVMTTGGAAGAAAVLFSASLSGRALFSGADRPTRKSAQSIAADLDRAIGQTHLTRSQKIWLLQLLHHFPPLTTDFTKADMDGEKLADLLIKRIKDSKVDGELKSDAAIDAYRRVMPPVFQAAIDRDIATDEAQSAMLKELLARSNKTGEADILREEGITEQAIIRLAQRIAAETDDVAQAWLELQNAMDIAVRVQKEGATPSNHQGFVDEVLKRVAELARDGSYAAASDAIDAALQRAEAEQMRLLDSGVEVALLDRNTERAAELLIRKADLDAGGVADFEALRALFLHYYEIGRVQGGNMNSRLAIDLAHAMLARAQKPDARGSAGNDLGNALQTLGSRENGTELLEQAVNAYETALLEHTRDRVPLDWAMTQMNIANTLTAIGKQTGDLTILERAVRIHLLALKERKRVPYDWGISQQNLGVTLRQCGVISRSLGNKTTAGEYFLRSASAFTSALQVRTKQRNLYEWIMTKGNLGNTLQDLFTINNNQTHLDQAILAYKDCTDQLSKQGDPIFWAQISSNLADAYSYLARFVKQQYFFKLSHDLYTSVLEIRRIDQMPLDHATTQFNFAMSLKEKYLLFGVKDDLLDARRRIDICQQLFQEGNAEYLIGRTGSLRYEIDLLLKT